MPHTGVGRFPSKVSITRLIVPVLLEDNDERPMRHPAPTNETRQRLPKVAHAVTTSSPTAISTGLTDVTSGPAGRNPALAGQAIVEPAKAKGRRKAFR